MNGSRISSSHQPQAVARTIIPPPRHTHSQRCGDISLNRTQAPIRPQVPIGATALEEETLPVAIQVELPIAYNINQIGPEGAEEEDLPMANPVAFSTVAAIEPNNNNQIGAAGAASFANAMRINTARPHLELEYNQVGAAGAARIAEALSQNPIIREFEENTHNLGQMYNAGAAEQPIVVSLWDNNIRPDGAAELAEVPEPPTIEDEGAARIEEALSQNPIHRERQETIYQSPITLEDRRREEEREPGELSSSNHRNNTRTNRRNYFSILSKLLKRSSNIHPN